MLAFRSLARAAPRVLPRVPRTTSSLLVRLPTARAVTLPRASYNFSTSVFRAAQSSGEVDAELSAKIESEIQFEEEVSKEEQMPASIKDFLSSGQFEVVDVEGKEEVKLVRNFGDEKYVWRKKQPLSIHSSAYPLFFFPFRTSHILVASQQPWNLVD